MKSISRPVMVCLAVFCAAMPWPVSACSIASDYEWPSLEERTREADYVIVGWVEETYPTPRLPKDASFREVVIAYKRGQVAEVSVGEWLKGAGPDLITVSGFGDGGDCRSLVPDGTAIMFLVGDAESGKLTIHDVGVYDAVIDNKPDYAAQIRATADE